MFFQAQKSTKIEHISNGSDDTMTTSLVILLNTTIPSMIIQQSSDEQLTTSHKKIHQLEKNCVMLRAKLPLFVLVYMQVVYTYFCEGPTVEIWLSSQSVMLS